VESRSRISPIDGTSASTPVRVYVADDHPVFREAVGRAVAAHPQFELVGSSADGLEALEQIRELEPTVALLDYRLPSLDGLEILQAIQDDGARVRVLMLTGSSTSDTVYDAVTLGAAGFLTKASTITEICEAILAAAAGRTVLAAAVQSGLAKEVRSRELGGQPMLSPRELEILTLIASGRTSPEIAAELEIKPSTVKTHVQNLFEKLGVSDRAAAVAEGMRRGLLE
jgi:two-component system, NarL family, nitrate/nitrite response regulator NarL